MFVSFACEEDTESYSMYNAHQPTERQPDSFVSPSAGGLSWRGALDGGGLVAATGTARIESATEPMRATDEQEAWDWVSQYSTPGWFL